MAAPQTRIHSTVTPMSRLKVRICCALLVFCAFSLGCTEFVVIGVETDIAEAFNVSVSTTGQLVSMFALPYAVCTPLLALGTGRFKRFYVLSVYCALFCFGNALSLFAPSFTVLLLSRILLGSISGALLAVLLTFIPDLVSPRKSSVALSIIYAAFSVAMIIITSIGKYIADTFDWHLVMTGVTILAFATCIAALIFLPKESENDVVATAHDQASLFTEPAVISGILIFVFGIGSVYTFYGYVTPYLEQVLGLNTIQISLTLLVYGFFCFVSNLLGGVIDNYFGVKALVVIYVLQGLGLLGLFFAGSLLPAALTVIFILALLMYIVSVPCVSLFMHIAHTKHPKALTLASSLEPMAFNIGIAFGTAMGGITVAHMGITSLGLIGAFLALLAVLCSAITYRLSRTATQTTISAQ